MTFDCAYWTGTGTFSAIGCGRRPCMKTLTGTSRVCTGAAGAAGAAQVTVAKTMVAAKQIVFIGIL
ncbi:hypothetical protein GCM10007387_18230 [Pseudoduganella albidiflava]|uniref:Uncharacterized protein n=1 Tax=Pseudoduganella albidiflava TaxID=321983 RepID=A0AA88C2D9_9BURK|nr:hypothetical protein GCM10007387_18230 [Pseudoduganella albidiflava]